MLKPEEIERRDEDDRDFVRALARGLAVIESFDGEPEAMTLSEVARRTGLSRGASRRLLHTLARLGYVGLDGNRFSLQPRTLRLGYAYLSSQPIWSLAQPYLQAVAQETGEACSAAVLDGVEIVFVARVAAKRIISDTIALGTRLPAYPASMGRVLLAGLGPEELDRYFASVKPVRLTPTTTTDEAELRRILEQVRRTGISYIDEEIEAGWRAIAVPVHDRQGRVVAAMNVSASHGRVERAVMETLFLPTLQRAARQVSELLARR
jgi:IclR family pca regulon transcriptional regulator